MGEDAFKPKSLDGDEDERGLFLNLLHELV
jgi:hypothetical protein